MGVADVGSVLVIPLLLEADLFEVPMRALPGASSNQRSRFHCGPGVLANPRGGRLWFHWAGGAATARHRLVRGRRRRCGQATCGGSPARVYAGRPRQRGRRGNRGNGPRGHPTAATIQRAAPRVVAKLG